MVYDKRIEILLRGPCLINYLGALRMFDLLFFLLFKQLLHQFPLLNLLPSFLWWSFSLLNLFLQFLICYPIWLRFRLFFISQFLFPSFVIGVIRITILQNLKIIMQSPIIFYQLQRFRFFIGKSNNLIYLLFVPIDFIGVSGQFTFSGVCYKIQMRF